jgi:hypothetical protein
MEPPLSPAAHGCSNCLGALTPCNKLVENLLPSSYDLVHVSHCNARSDFDL